MEGAGCGFEVCRRHLAISGAVKMLSSRSTTWHQDPLDFKGWCGPCVSAEGHTQLQTVFIFKVAPLVCEYLQGPWQWHLPSKRVGGCNPHTWWPKQIHSTPESVGVVPRSQDAPSLLVFCMVYSHLSPNMVLWALVPIAWNTSANNTLGLPSL